MSFSPVVLLSHSKYKGHTGDTVDSRAVPPIPAIPELSADAQPAFSVGGVRTFYEQTKGTRSPRPCFVLGKCNYFTSNCSVIADGVKQTND